MGSGYFLVLRNETFTILMPGWSKTSKAHEDTQKYRSSHPLQLYCLTCFPPFLCCFSFKFHQELKSIGTFDRTCIHDKGITWVEVLIKEYRLWIFRQTDKLFFIRMQGRDLYVIFTLVIFIPYFFSNSSNRDWCSISSSKRRGRYYKVCRFPEAEPARCRLNASVLYKWRVCLSGYRALHQGHRSAS